VRTINLILVLSFTMLMGAVMGGTVGFDPLISGILATFILSFSKVPNGALSIDGVDVSAIRTQIEEYFKYYSKTIWVNILKGTDFEQYMKPIPGVRNRYVTTSSARGEFLQPWQKGWTPKLGVAIKPYVNTIYDIKMDTTLDNLHELYKTYLAFLNDENKTPDKFPIVKWLFDYHIIPGITEELRAMSVKGVYVAPTPGMAGSSLSSANGVFTIIANEVADGNITPIPVGAITTSNIVEKYEKFNRDLPSEWVGKEGFIFVSSQRLQDYIYAYRDAFGQNRDFEGPTTKLWGTSKTLVGLDDLNGSDRMLYTPTGVNGNLLKMYDKIVMPNPTIQLDKRDVHILTDFARGWGFDCLDVVFVNDVPEDEEE
jgi:hypothetical protein